MKLKVESTEKPKWHQFRWKISNWLIKLARKARPENPNLKAYLAETLLDQAIYGNSVTRVYPRDFYTKDGPDVHEAVLEIIAKRGGGTGRPGPCAAHWWKRSDTKPE